MRLISLKAENFRVLKKVSLIFPDRVIGIIGPNGAGKSSIIEAIAWALYGNSAARTGKEGIRSSFAGGSHCEVELGFSINEQSYRVVRRLSGKTDRAEAFLYRGEKTEAVGVSETGRRITELIGLDWRGFLSSFLARQQELNALSDLQPARRKDHLAGMLGIERLDKAIQKVKDDNKATGEKIGYISRTLGEADLVKKQIEELTGKSMDLENDLKVAKQKFDNIKKEHDKLTASLKESQQVMARWRELMALAAAEKATKLNIDQQLAGSREELVRLLEYQKEIEKLKKRLEEMPPVKEKLTQLQLAKTQAGERARLHENMTADGQKKIELEKSLTERNEVRSKLSSELEKMPGNLDEQFAQASEQLDKARDSYSQAQALTVQLSGELIKAKKRIESIGQFGPDSVCDRCHRPLGDDLEKIREHFSAELLELNEKKKRLDDKLVQSAAEGKKLRSVSDDLSSRINKRDDLIGAVKKSEQESKSIEEQLISVNGNLTRGEKQLSEIPSVQFNDQDYNNATLKYEALEKDRSEYDRLRGLVERSETVQKEIERLTAQSLEIASGQEKLKAQIKETGFDEKEVEKLETKYSQAQKELDSARDNLVGSEGNLKSNKDELKIRNEHLRSFEKSRKELEVSRSDQFYGEKLALLFGQFKTELIARIRPTLAELSGRLVSQMTNDRYSMVELDEQYNLRLMDNGEFFEVERFSGGEKDLANLCLRLAISQALTESAGLDRSFIILDEVFGSQDQSRRELIINSLSHLTGPFPQILLITHIEEIKDRVEELIEVRPTAGGYSEVIVQSARADHV